MPAPHRAHLSGVEPLVDSWPLPGHNSGVCPADRRSETLSFTVDAALLRELGERLVGQPQIALAELVKNAYDADARQVVIRFDPGRDMIVVEDNGHGMSFADFEHFWMRVGTTHKTTEQVSPELKRTLTGSKGVGRLAVQLLASHLKVETVALTDKTLEGHQARRSTADLEEPLSAEINWHLSADRERHDVPDSVPDESGALILDNVGKEEERKPETVEDLTNVTVPVTVGGDRPTFPMASNCGTRLVLTGLRHRWDAGGFRQLAQEIWFLQPPFEVDENEETSFVVHLESPDGGVETEFDTQMSTILENWQGRVDYDLLVDDGREVTLDLFADSQDEKQLSQVADDGVPKLTYADASPNRSGRRSRIVQIVVHTKIAREESVTYLVRVRDCPIDRLKAEVRAFNLVNRQPGNIAVADARAYMDRFGGVNIYDGGFRLPYYGPQDWLNLSWDHARRLSRSTLLPHFLQSPGLLEDLPPARRVFGMVNISTAHEASVSSYRGAESLAIQITRDRLVDNRAYRTLVRIMRTGIDLYAARAHEAKARRKAGNVRPVTRKQRAEPARALKELSRTLSALEQEIEPSSYRSLTDGIETASSAIAEIQRSSENSSMLLGALATVGMTTLAWKHEADKQQSLLRTLIAELESYRIAERSADSEMVSKLKDSLERLSRIGRLFAAVGDEKTREEVCEMKAKPFLKDLARDLKVLGRGADVEVVVANAGQRLPAATAAVWTAIVQNLVINAFNAVLSTEDRRVKLDLDRADEPRWLRVQDTGVGLPVPLTEAKKYFEPFVRGMNWDQRRADLNLGGSGLGLAIVRMLCAEIDASVAFEEPDPGYVTSVVVRW